ncbi:MAG: hypothetical protein NXH72_11170 [Hyphomonadaceae bacterium]|nr:hypothetical protein [Hyphomonadaceae bacterium]
MVSSTAQDRGMVMIEARVNWAGQASTAWWVLSIAVTVIVFEAVRASKDVFWADMVDEDE